MSIMALSYLLFLTAGLTLCLVRHPIWGLYTYVLVFYVDAPSRWWSVDIPDIRWSFLVVAVTMVAALFHKVRSREAVVRKSFFGHSPQTLFILYVVWMFVQFAWVISPDHANGVTYFTKYAVIAYLIYTLVDSRERVIGFLAAHVIGCFYLGLLAFSIVGGGRLDGIGGAGIDDSNNLGIYMATAAIAGAGLHLVLKGWLKWSPAVAMPFVLNTLVQAGSRGAFLALLAGFIVMYLYRPLKTTAIVWSYGVIGIVLFAFLASNSFWERIESIQDAAQQAEEADRSAVSRIYIAQAQWQMATKHPFGVGHKGTTVLSYEYIDDEFMSAGGGRSSHNTFLSALVDQGFVGLAIWLTICCTLFLKCRSVYSSARRNGDTELGWLASTILSILSVTWVGGIFTPFLKGEVFVWMIALACSLWTSSVGVSGESPVQLRKKMIQTM